MTMYENDLVLVESYRNSYIGKVNRITLKNDSYDSVLLSEAFKVQEIILLTPQGAMMPAGATMSPIVHNYDKPVEIDVKISSIVKIDDKMPIRQMYDSAMAKCSGIVLADATALNNIKKIEL